jgi:hypothetical protein
VKFWFCCMSFLWVLFGATTFAPVIYIGNRVDALVNYRKKSLLFSFLLYVSFVAFVVILASFR